jgi:hypothetical protein
MPPNGRPSPAPLVPTEGGGASPRPLLQPWILMGGHLRAQNRQSPERALANEWRAVGGLGDCGDAPAAAPQRPAPPSPPRRALPPRPPHAAAGLRPPTGSATSLRDSGGGVAAALGMHLGGAGGGVAPREGVRALLPPGALRASRSERPGAGEPSRARESPRGEAPEPWGGGSAREGGPAEPRESGAGAPGPSKGLRQALAQGRLRSARRSGRCEDPSPRGFTGEIVFADGDGPQALGKRR